MTADFYTVKDLLAMPASMKESGKWMKEYLQCSGMALDKGVKQFAFNSREGALRLQSALRSYSARQKTIDLQGWTFKTSVKGNDLYVQRVSVKK